MKKLFMILPLVLVLCFVYSCEKEDDDEAAVDVAAGTEAVLDAFNAWSKANDEKDIERMASFFAHDSGSYIDSKFQDRAYLREFWKDTFAKGSSWIGYPPEKIVVSTSEDLAYLIFGAQFKRSEGGESKTSEKYDLLLVWQKQADDSWKIVAFK